MARDRYGITARYIEVRLSNGITLHVHAQHPQSTLAPDENGANDQLMELLKQLPAGTFTREPRFIPQR